MIVDAIIGVALAVLGGFVALFPSYTLPGSMTGVGSNLGSAVATINGVFPVVTLGICIAAVLGLAVFLAAFNAVVWVYQLVPLKFT